jgi:hypothetical protein
MCHRGRAHYVNEKLACVATSLLLANHLLMLLQREIKDVQTTQSSDTDLLDYCNSATAGRHHGASHAFAERNRCKNKLIPPG